MSARKRGLLAMAGVGAACLVWMVVVFALWTAHFRIAPRVEAMFPDNRLVARPRPMSLSIIQLGPSRVPEPLADQIAQWPGVLAVHRQSAITLPLRASISILGQTVDTDAIVNGVDPALVCEDDATRAAFVYQDDPAAEVPVMASRYFLDMYNMGYAESQGLPRVNQSAVVGRTFDLILGESIASGPQAKQRTVRCRIVGLTTDVSLIGLVVPLEYARQWNAWYHGRPDQGFTALHVSVADAETFARVERELRDLGLAVDSHRETLERARLMLRLLTTGSLALGGLVVFLAGLNMWNTFTLILMQQRRQIGALRAVGAPPRLIFLLYGAEALALAMAGCALALAAAAGAGALLAERLGQFLAEFEFLGALALGPAVAAAVAGAPLVVIAVCVAVAPQIRRICRTPIPELL